MALARQTFDHDSPSAPTRALGMLLGASGVSHPPVQTVGILTATSSADGSFNDTAGWGHIDYDSAGYMYVMDQGNNRCQRFVKNSSGVWTFDSKVTTVTTLLGGGNAPSLMAIDRTNNQIHMAAYNHYTASNWISVWSLTDWPTLTTGNRLRQYGANASSNTADRAYDGFGLAIDATYAVVSSLSSPHRQLRWNHQTGVLQNQETQTSTFARWATDGAGNWWSFATSGSDPGLQKNDPSTFTGIARLDVAAVGSQWRRNRNNTGNAYNPVYHSGRVYLRDYLGRVSGWVSADGSFADDFIAPGSLAAGGVVAGNSGWTASSNPMFGNSGIVVDADGCAWYVAWSSNADNTGNQCFLTMWPLSAATATWTKTDWSAGTNTIKALSLKGTSLSGEKYKIRLKKNSGSWTTITPDIVQDEGTLDFETFTSGDTLTIELSLSTWDRLDGHATLTATRDKLSPANVAVQMVYEDTVADVYVPYASAGFKGKVGIQGAYKGQIGT